MEDFYKWLMAYKKSTNISYAKLGEAIKKKGNAMRMAVERESLSDLEKEKIAQVFGNSAQEKPPLSEVRFEEIVAGKVIETLGPYLDQFKESHEHTGDQIHSLITLIRVLAVRVDELADEVADIKGSCSATYERVKDMHEVVTDHK